MLGVQLDLWTTLVSRSRSLLVDPSTGKQARRPRCLLSASTVILPANLKAHGAPPLKKVSTHRRRPCRQQNSSLPLLAWRTVGLTTSCSKVIASALLLVCLCLTRIKLC